MAEIKKLSKASKILLPILTLATVVTGYNAINNFRDGNTALAIVGCAGVGIWIYLAWKEYGRNK